jgi:hypothetical protein
MWGRVLIRGDCLIGAFITELLGFFFREGTKDRIGNPPENKRETSSNSPKSFFYIRHGSLFQNVPENTNPTVCSGHTWRWTFADIKEEPNGSTWCQSSHHMVWLNGYLKDHGANPTCCSIKSPRNSLESPWLLAGSRHWDGVWRRATLVW